MLVESVRVCRVCESAAKTLRVLLEFVRVCRVCERAAKTDRVLLEFVRVCRVCERATKTVRVLLESVRVLQWLSEECKALLYAHTWATKVCEISCSEVKGHDLMCNNDYYC
jgi:hypothetical protein